MVFPGDPGSGTLGGGASSSGTRVWLCGAEVQQMKTPDRITALRHGRLLPWLILFGLIWIAGHVWSQDKAFNLSGVPFTLEDSTDRVDVYFQPENVKKGGFKGSLKILTNDDEFKQIVLPIHGKLY